MRGAKRNRIGPHSTLIGRPPTGPTTVHESAYKMAVDINYFARDCRIVFRQMSHPIGPCTSLLLELCYTVAPGLVFTCGSRSVAGYWVAR